MKMTLLDITQSILSAMDSDYANSIGDTVEAEQVATIVKETYYYLINNILDLPEHKEIISLTALADTNHPTYFTIPSNVKRIELFRYNRATASDTDLNYGTVEYITPIEFQNLVNMRKESDSAVIKYSDFSAGSLLIQNDKHPDYWTSFDDNYIVCDSFLSSLDSTLQASKTFCYGLTEPTWTHSDNFIPDLDSHLFPLLLEEAKSAAFVYLKQVSNPNSQSRARKQLTQLYNSKHRVPRNRHDEQPNYGRRR
jgi:hypothetical protein